MAAPACTGKTTVSILALQTLGFSEEAMASSYLSLRDDSSLEIIEQLHSTVVSLDSAPFYPLIIDDSERVAAFFGSGLEEKILEISTYLPVLLITRENFADMMRVSMPNKHKQNKHVISCPHSPQIMSNTYYSRRILNTKCNKKYNTL